MTVELEHLIKNIDPANTVLLFGAGSSLPSGAPCVGDLITSLSQKFTIPSSGFSLRDVASLVETNRSDRAALIKELRRHFVSVKPKAGILNLPKYDWKAIYSTNYDNIVEQSYGRANRPLKTYCSNADFSGDEDPAATKYYKLHGTIEKDVVDGYNARIIISDADYGATDDYRQFLYDRLKGDMAGADVVIIGQSLADEHIQSVVQRTIELNTQNHCNRINLLVYSEDKDRASLYETKGLRVTFGGIDEFFEQLAKAGPQHKTAYTVSDDLLDRFYQLRPTTIAVSGEIETEPDISGMFNGWPASYSTISAGYTFHRTVCENLQYEVEKYHYFAILGASGLGKTTLARQFMCKLHAIGFQCWEHHPDRALQPRVWFDLATALQESGGKGALFVDDASNHLAELNQLFDLLNSKDNDALKVILTSGKNQWSPRVKSPTFYSKGNEYPLTRLDSQEIDGLLKLVENEQALHPLIEDQFSGFSRNEKRRRLVVRCDSETFVCLRNIFASERFDDIILREYAALTVELQEVYKIVAAMENSGIRVHRQLVMRLLGIDATHVHGVLGNLEGIIDEYTINDREGVYGWRGRHPVIVGIVTQHKFYDIDKKVQLLENVIESISPTYEIEIRSIRELCNVDTGIPSIPDKRIQNHLLRKMISIAPGERVPRHRLVRNLIDMEEFEKAETEIRIFQKDFGSDGPIARYKVTLICARATQTKGILAEDRIAILHQAESYAVSVLDRYKSNKHFLRAYAELGIDLYKHTKSMNCFDAAMKQLKMAEINVGDPDITRIIRRLENRVAGFETIET